MSLTLVDFVKQQEPLFIKAATDERMVWAKESQFAIQLFQNNDYLAKVAFQNQTSTQNAIINVAAIGISLNPAQKLAYLVPRKGAICLDISYMGLMHIAQQSGAIKWCQSAIVRRNDQFRREGDQILGLTTIGRTTVFLLQMNAPHRAELRQENLDEWM